MPHTARSRRLFLTGELLPASGFSAVALAGSGLVLLLPASPADTVSVGRSGGMMGLVARSLATIARNCVGWGSAAGTAACRVRSKLSVQAGRGSACLCWVFVSLPRAFLALVLYACWIGCTAQPPHPQRNCCLNLPTPLTLKKARAETPKSCLAPSWTL
jgi:hypothetical protein